MYNMGDKNALYEQLHAVQKKLPEGDIVMGDLAAKVSSDNTLIGFVVVWHILGDRIIKDEKFVDFCSFYCLCHLRHLT